ncbi:hypothetical protein [Streptomyces sp. McG3]|uniref:hypothetical protein n=1 Tax=Streptomyces sp. McG3 TaxID=2725483 RepID=UPI001BEAF660|nr:hypothetical protein [Streptomyces sp. McG3]MBT2897208.1 hypothetical protein [Streptomyces sp. McG3]
MAVINTSEGEPMSPSSGPEGNRRISIDLRRARAATLNVENRPAHMLLWRKAGFPSLLPNEFDVPLPEPVTPPKPCVGASR